ncbi:MAG: hypothetical protein KIT10_10515 [Flavobacteriales bacterium]|nr:hypothetical protein [Flavobacteriales bacterium]
MDDNSLLEQVVIRLPHVIVVSVLSCAAFAQEVDVLWSATYGGTHGDWLDDVKWCPDGGVIAVGRTLSNNGDVTGNHDPTEHHMDIWLVKLDSTGALEWQGCYGSPMVDYPRRVAVAADGGYFVVGTATVNGGDVSGCHGGKDGWIFKTDQAGTLVWQNCIGGSADDEFWDVEALPDGGALILGYTYSNNGDVSGHTGTSTDALLVRVDVHGTIIWQHCFGNDQEYGRTMTRTPDGHVTILGERLGNAGCPWGGYELWAASLNAAGVPVWTTCAGGSGHESARGIARTADHGYVFVGASTSTDHHATGNHDPSGSTWDMFVVRTNSTGAILWSKMLGGTGNDGAEDVAVLPDGTIRVVGWTNSNDHDVSGNHGSRDVWIVDLDDGGQMLWSQSFGGSLFDEGWAMDVSPTGATVIGARSTSSDGDVPGTPMNWIDYWVFAIAPKDFTTHGGQPLSAGPDIQVAYDPTAGIRITCATPLRGRVSILDATGRMIQETGMDGTDLHMPVPGVAPGLYYLSITHSVGRRVKKMMLSP